ncbi:unnamed protein product [Chondrus crispus]|uniref:Uncharacterized protein n=1 Tax=Chondrus crispus TaxID=2769 RepID=R7QLL8_CHOCR|nr:unnamed protein product [Chondrus crispus]CDF38366.1 unnamed protein product [Chondrus crispus]|eukprot:XP_005718251.1 unnamed protein product [Chondrus crispus]
MLQQPVREGRHSDDRDDRPKPTSSWKSSGVKSFHHGRGFKDTQKRAAQQANVPDDQNLPKPNLEHKDQGGLRSRTDNLKFLQGIPRFRKRNNAGPEGQTKGASLFRQEKPEKQKATQQTRNKTTGQLLGLTFQTRKGDSGEGLEQEQLLKAAKVTRSSANDDSVCDMNPNDSQILGGRRQYKAESKDDRDDAPITPSVSGMWARMTGEMFRAQLNANSSPNDEIQIEVRPSETSKKEDGSNRRRGDLFASLKSLTVRADACRVVSNRECDQVVSSQMRDPSRTKKQKPRTSDIESPWGVKCESDESFDVEQRTRSIHLSIHPFGSRTNTKTRQRSTEGDDNVIANLSDGIDEYDDGSSLARDREGEDVVHIEMFRDAFVDYTLKSLRSNQHKTMADRIRNARKPKTDLNE